MNEERETAYGPVLGYLALIVVLLFGVTYIRRPNPKVTMVLTYPAPYGGN